MNRFKDKHKGQRAFIAANGPGLNDIDVSKLEGEVVFGLNRGYLKKGMPIMYLVVVNPTVERQFGTEILAAKKEALFSHSLPNSFHLKWTGDIPSFQEDVSKPMWQGHTVTYVAMQLAFYMGCSPVYVIGLDHSYDYSTSKKSVHGGVVSVQDDPNHFSPDYFGEGVQWDPANLTRSALAYGLARARYEGDGREIYNASSNTQLPEDILRRVDFNEVKFVQE